MSLAASVLLELVANSLWQRICHLPTTMTVTAKGGSVSVELLHGWAVGRVVLAETSTVVMLP